MKELKLILIIFLFWNSQNLYCQLDSISIQKSQKFHFNGQLTLTNNGVSIIPNFSLNKPAILFDLFLGNEKISFDPMLRFGADGKPWTLVFWGRYKLIQENKFKMSLGLHNSLIFKNFEIYNTNNNLQNNILGVNRYLALELTPTFSINNKIDVGIYYLGSIGINEEAINNTNFVSFKSNIKNIKLGKKLSSNLSQQFYYLKQEKNKGLYYNFSYTIGKSNSNFGFNFTTMKEIKSTIIGKDFFWSIGLIYNFKNNYLKN